MSRVYIGDNSFKTLVAVSIEEQAKGLMWKEWPPPVMIFPYKRATYNKFWMKNTVSPLDIVFCCNGKVVGIYKGEPMSTAMVGPEGLSDLVVELPYGTVKENSIKIGDDVKIVYSDDDAAKLILKQS